MAFSSGEPGLRRVDRLLLQIALETDPPDLKQLSAATLRRIEAEAYRQRCLPAVFRAMERSALRPSPAFLAKLRERLELLNALRDERSRLARRLSQAGLRCAFAKGAALDALYANPPRQFHDLDLIVAAGKAGWEALRLLIDDGYWVRGASFRTNEGQLEGAVALERARPADARPHLRLDLHLGVWPVNWSSGVTIDEAFWSACRPGKLVEGPEPSPPSSLMFLAAETLDRRRIFARDVADLVALLKIMTEAELIEGFSLVQRWGLQQSLRRVARNLPFSIPAAPGLQRLFDAANAPGGSGTIGRMLPARMRASVDHEWRTPQRAGRNVVRRVAEHWILEKLADLARSARNPMALRLAAAAAGRIRRGAGFFEDFVMASARFSTHEVHCFRHGNRKLISSEAGLFLSASLGLVSAQELEQLTRELERAVATKGQDVRTAA
jgi:hypothetical protein